MDEQVLVSFRDLFLKKSKKELMPLYRKLLYDGTNNFSQLQFKGAIKKLKNYDGSFSDAEFDQIFETFQVKGKIGSSEFLKAVRGDLSMYRKLIVEFAFKKLDKSSSGFLKEGDLVLFFKESVIPAILFKTTTPRAMAHDIVLKIAKANLIDDAEKYKISFDHFSEYYLDKSLQQDNDAAFSAAVLDPYNLKASWVH